MRYFLGTATDLGNVSKLPYQTFAELTENVLEKPIRLSITRDEYNALAYNDKSNAKRTAYLVPAAFGEAKSPRKTEKAIHCNLIALDIDDNDQSKKVLNLRFEGLKRYSYTAYHTASSTDEKPRIRVFVAADHIPLSEYSRAVRTVAALLALETVTKESLISVQGMYLPSVFKDDTTSPIIASNAGEEITRGCLIPDKDMPVANPEGSALSDKALADLSHLREPLESVTMEDAKGALEMLNPDCSMDDWISAACALKHQFGEEGFDLWNEWSSRGKKYPGDKDAAYRWGTIKAQTTDRVPITIRSLFKQAAAKGWTSPNLSHRTFITIGDYIRSLGRTQQELLDQGLKKIAKSGSTLTAVERASLVATLKDALKKQGVNVPLATLNKDITRLETEESNYTLPSWANGIVFITADNYYYTPSVERRWDPEVIETIYKVPVGLDGKKVSAKDYLIHTVGIPQVENRLYVPSMGDKQLINVKGKPYINTYKANYPVANLNTMAEAGAIFMEHMTNLIAEEEYRKILIDFLAFNVQKPGVKIRWAPILQGTQGCGKTFLAVVMNAVLGDGNVRKAGTDDILGSFNAWAYGQQLVVIEEIRIVGSNRMEIMNKIKPLITDDQISLNIKFQSSVNVDNTVNFLLFTNHHDALAINDQDRRYFVLESRLQNPEQVEEMGGDKYFNKLFTMVRDNAEGLRAFFEQWKISEEFNPNGRAPKTKYFDNLVEMAATPLASAIEEAFHDNTHPLIAKDLVSLQALRNYLQSSNLPHFTDQGLSAILKEKGWTKFGRCRVKDERHILWVKGLRRNAGEVALERIDLI